MQIKIKLKKNTVKLCQETVVEPVSKLRLIIKAHAKDFYTFFPSIAKRKNNIYCVFRILI